jgi:hypothetical protein
MKLLKQPILNTKKTKNDTVYHIEVLEIIRNQINSKGDSLKLGTIGFPDGLTVSLSEGAFKYSNAVIENEVLYVDIETIHTPEGVKLRNTIDRDLQICFRPAGISTLLNDTPNKVVHSDYQLITIAAIQKEDDSLNL